MFPVHIHQESNMRRIILAGLALVAAATVVEIPRADAQVSSPRNPWCIRDGSGRGSWDCSYHNRAQCEFSARGAGGFCTPNPNYGGRQSNRRRQDNSWDSRGGTWGWSGGRW